MLFKDASSGDNLLKYIVRNETNALYLKGISELTRRGYRILGVVCDGRRYLIQALTPYPVQLCQYHQIKTILRYLPKKSTPPSAQALRLIAIMITEITEKQLEDFLAQWFDEWRDYYEERSVNPETGKSYYTHRRLRSAFKSLMNNLPHLFTYQKCWIYPSTAPNSDSGV